MQWERGTHLTQQVLPLQVDLALHICAILYCKHSVFWHLNFTTFMSLAYVNFRLLFCDQNL